MTGELLREHAERDGLEGGEVLPVLAAVRHGGHAGLLQRLGGDGADLGVVGKDTLLEHGGQGLYQPLDLQIAKCRMSVAVRSDFDYAGAVKQGSRIRVATKFTQIARDHFAEKGVHVDLIKLYGSMELAPLAGLADAIVDLVSTGGTLKANKLVAVEDIMGISSRLVVNQASLKVKRETLQPIIDAFARAVEK